MHSHTILAMALSAAALSSAAPAAAQTKYSLVADYSGTSFFDGFTAFTAASPTHGNAQYVDMASAAQDKLMGFIAHPESNTTNAYIGVDYTSTSAMRNSVRITSNQAFSPGMMAVVDMVHAPTGYGTWPAVWFLGNGAIWPNSGESDFFESVHITQNNQMTLHTAPGCNVDNSSTLFQGDLLSDNCNDGNGDNGCSILASANDHDEGKTLATAGSDFNKQGGGVYVHEWTNHGITVWIFPRGQTPADLASGHPDTGTWTAKPLAKFSGDGCNYAKSFTTMAMIVNIELCGDWAGKVWDSEGAANATGVATCAEYVQNNPAKFKDAYFEFAGIQIYAASQPTKTPAQQKRDAIPASMSFPHIDLAKRYDDCMNGTAMSSNSTSAINGTSLIAKHFGHRHHGMMHNRTHAHNCTANGTQVHPRMPASTGALPELNMTEKTQTFGFGGGVGLGWGAAASVSVDSPIVYAVAAAAALVVAFAI